MKNKPRYRIRGALICFTITIVIEVILFSLMTWTAEGNSSFDFDTLFMTFNVPGVPLMFLLLAPAPMGEAEVTSWDVAAGVVVVGGTIMFWTLLGYLAGRVAEHQDPPEKKLPM